MRYPNGGSASWSFSTPPTILESATGTLHDALRYDGANGRLLGIGNSGYGCGGNYESIDVAGDAVEARFKFRRLPMSPGDGSYWELYLGLMPSDSEPDVGRTCTYGGPNGRFDNHVGVVLRGDGESRRSAMAVWVDGSAGPDLGMAIGYTYNVVILVNGGLPPVPSAPRNLAATGEKGAIRLDWAAPAQGGSVSYRVYSGGQLLAETASTTFRESGLPENATRAYTVTARNVAGEGAAAGPVSATSWARPYPPQKPRAEPSIAPGTVTVTWSAPANDGGGAVTGYELFMGEEGGPLRQIATLPADARRHQDERVPPGRWTYAVRAVNVVGPGSFATSTTGVVSIFQSPPTGLTAVEGARKGEIELSWRPPPLSGSEIVGYRVYRSNEHGGRDYLAETSGTTFRDRFVPFGTWEYAVTSMTLNGESRFASTVQVASSGPIVFSFGDSVAAGHGFDKATGFPNNNDIAFPGQISAILGGTTYNFAISGACSTAWWNYRAHPNTSRGCEKGVASHEIPVARDPARNFPRPSLLTVTAAGNDIEFDACIRNFFAPWTAAGEPCSTARLTRHLDAYEYNMNELVIPQLREAFGEDVPLLLTKYYQAFPYAPGPRETPCSIFIPAVYYASPSSPVLTTDARLLQEATRLKQIEAAALQEQVVTAMNERIQRIADRWGAMVATPDFFDHDMCRGIRDGKKDQTYVFAPAFDLLVKDGFTTVAHYVGPREPSSCVTPLDPNVPTSNWWWGGYYFRMDAWVNCMPHPTAEGHRAIAQAVVDALRKEVRR